MSYKEAFAVVIERGIDRGMTVGDIADKAGAPSPQHFWNWRQTATQTPLGELKKTCKACKATASETTDLIEQWFLGRASTGPMSDSIALLLKELRKDRTGDDYQKVVTRCADLLAKRIEAKRRG